MGRRGIANVVLLGVLAGSVWIAAAVEAPCDEATGHWSSAEAMHRQYERGFIEASGFGPNRLPARPLRDWRKTLSVDGVRYRITAIDLIGVARHGQPVAYAGLKSSDTDARSGVLAAGIGLNLDVHNNHSRTRALDDFERTALAQLIAKRGLEVAGAADGDGRRALGGLRAQPDCLRCHDSYHDGDVLGALSYRLARLPAPTDKP
jgi:hypothetical protein